MQKILVTVFLVLNIAFIGQGFKQIVSYDSRAYEMPEGCRGLGFCKDKGDHYPTEVVNMVLRRVLQFQHRFAEKIENYEFRVSDSPLDPECGTNEIKFQPLYYILDRRNETRVVIQSEKLNFLQRYEIRWCKKEGRVFNTLNFRRTVLRKFNMTCRNVKTTLDFQVLTLDKLGMELISMEMPVFCKARYDLIK